MNYFKEYVVVFLKAKMEYRFSFFMDLFSQIFTNTINCLCIWVLTVKFENIAGWSFYELLLLYSVNLLSFGLGAQFFWSPMYNMDGMIKNGDFDKVLCKPISPFFYMMISQFDYVFFAHIFMGTVLLVISILRVNVNISVMFVIKLLILLGSATLIQAALLIICGAVNFWIVKSGQLIDILVWNVRKFLEYPISIYGMGIKIFLTFLIPYAFVSYYPASIILDKDIFWGTNRMFMVVTPIFSIFLFALSVIIWHCGLNRYDSTGT